jgi:putative ABC transport system permease protein
MYIFKLLKFAFQNIFRNRMRSLLTSLGIIIGVGSVIVMVAIGQGSQNMIEAQLEAMGTNMLMIYPARRGSRLTKDDLTKIRNESTYIQAVTGLVQRNYTVVGGEGNWQTQVVGANPDYLTIRNWQVDTGNFFGEEDVASRNRVAVLGTTVVTNLFGNNNPIGESIRIGTNHFRVIGVLKTLGAAGMGNDQDDIIIVPLDTAMSRLNKTRWLSSIQISVIRKEYMSNAQREVEAILKESHNIRADGEADFEIMNMADIIATASETSKTLTNLLAAIAGVSLLVGGIGIMNIMLVSVTERTREIGIRMSVGARKSDILIQFLLESLILSLMGGIIGILLAVGIGKILSLTGMPFAINPMIVLLAVAFAGLVGIFFGYYPARKAAGLYPIDALRYE